jgi:nitrate reductase beta subunit
MKIRAQMAMVMNLDKCIGCHTCSIPCKYVWTNRPGTEYMWFNNVETKPGIGYPKKWENQSLHRGGWEIKNGKLRLVARERISKLLNIFHNPDLPPIDDYYEPWTYTYESLVSSPVSHHQPVAKAKSLITGQRLDVQWSPGWEDDLAGVNTTGAGDVNFNGLDHQAYLRFAQVFMFHLPRICEHCLNPACVASCPSGALYKREEDGIVLVDQERCRGWRYCVSGCPYKKVYYNWKSGRSEKCLFCYPRIEGAMTTLCSQSCVGRIRSVGVVLYDADRIKETASVSKDEDVYKAHCEMLLNPNDPDVATLAKEQGVRENFINAARNSPIYKLAIEWKVAFPLHPEFRTLPMVWYVPPLAPLGKPSEEVGIDPQPDTMRIPVRYLANLLTAGDEAPVRLALSRLLALRAYMRSLRVERKPNLEVLEAVGLNESAAHGMYRLLAIAKVSDRYVLPSVRREDSEDLYLTRGACGIPES